MAPDLEAIEKRFAAAAGGPDGEDRRAEVRDFLAHAWAGVPALLADNRRLREALEPFAALAEYFTKAGQNFVFTDDLHTFRLGPAEAGVSIRLSDCQRAAEVLK